VVIHPINIESIILDKAENHTPIGANGYSVKALPFTLERMKSKTRQIQVRNGSGCTETRQNVAQFDGIFGHHASRIVIFVKPL